MDYQISSFNQKKEMYILKSSKTKTSIETKIVLGQEEKIPAIKYKSVRC